MLYIFTAKHLKFSTSKLAKVKCANQLKKKAYLPEIRKTIEKKKQRGSGGGVLFEKNNLFAVKESYRSCTHPQWIRRFHK